MFDFAGDENCADYAASLVEFTKDSEYGSEFANSLLDHLTYGEHRKTLAKLMENSRDKYEQYQVDKTFPNPSTAAEDEKYKDVKIDFNSLRSLSDLGLDVDFLNQMEDDVKTIETYKELQSKLKNNSELIERLHDVQNERLSQNLPLHLSNVAHPDEGELNLATQITANLTEISKQLPPYAIVSPYSLRKAMGVSNGSYSTFNRFYLSSVQSYFYFCLLRLVGLEPIDDASYQDNTNNPTTLESNAPPVSNLDASSIPMEIDSEPPNETQNDVDDPPTETQVDLESELREFLEGDTTNLATSDDVANIDQMLLA